MHIQWASSICLKMQREQNQLSGIELNESNRSWGERETDWERALPKHQFAVIKLYIFVCASVFVSPFIQLRCVHTTAYLINTAPHTIESESNIAFAFILHTEWMLLSFSYLLIQLTCHLKRKKEIRNIKNERRKGAKEKTK